MQKTFKLGSIEITVQTAQTIRDDLKGQIISQRAQTLEADRNSFGFWDTFGDLCAHTVKATGLLFDPVTLHEQTALDAHSAYETWLGMNKKLRRLWQDACREVDADDADPVLGPNPLADDADPNL